MTAITLRRADLADAPLIQSLLQEQAVHHDEVLEAGVEALERFGFGPKALFCVILAERAGGAMGFAL